MPCEEQIDVKTASLEGEPAKEGTPPGPGGVTMATSFVGLAGGGTSAISEAERQQLEAEKMQLYQQLDDKVWECVCVGGCVGECVCVGGCGCVNACMYMCMQVCILWLIVHMHIYMFDVCVCVCVCCCLVVCLGLGQKVLTLKVEVTLADTHLHVFVFLKLYDSVNRSSCQ